jgi:peptidoglycan/LPS O-acetylase OafA/YrhL
LKKGSNIYYPSLDSLRAIAVILVIISHWFASDHFLNRYTSNGTLGVTLFFVLSGFLISGILMNYKTEIDLEVITIKQTLKIFYIRRAVRIFPIYYVLIGVLLLFQFSLMKDGFWWHFFYLSNVYFWLQGAFHGSLSHFWSLAVEEQFYLIWPMMILLISWKRLPMLLIIGIFSALAFRFMAVDDQNEMARYLLPGSIDSFCVGAIFALVQRELLPKLSAFLKRKDIQWLGGLGFFVLSQGCLIMPFSVALTSALYIFLISCAFGFLILGCCQENQVMTRIPLLQNPILIYIGKISYGLYLYHNFIPFFYGFNFSWIPISFSMYVVQLMRFIVLLIVASASWYFIEKPILRLKNRFTIQNL